MKHYGLIGRNIEYSFSRSYFAEKFASENIRDADYLNFDIQDIESLLYILAETRNLKGLNVTIPYKQSIIPYLDKLSETAREIGAVNTIKIHDDGTLEGFNTDEYGFRKSLELLLKPHHRNALILGTGGASKAVAFALKSLGISYQFVSRKRSENTIGYEELPKLFDHHQIVINTTPVGTFPNVDDCPDIPYEKFSPNHIAYDLIYNPTETLFLKKAAANGATVKSGLEMLQLQAEKAWEIWNN